MCVLKRSVMFNSLRPYGLCGVSGSSVQGSSWQEYLCGSPLPPPGDLPDLETESVSSTSPVLQADSLPLNHQGRPKLDLDPFKRGWWRGLGASCSAKRRWARTGLTRKQRVAQGHRRNDAHMLQNLLTGQSQELAGSSREQKSNQKAAFPLNMLKIQAWAASTLLPRQIRFKALTDLFSVCFPPLP